MEADVGRSEVEVLTEHAILMRSGLELAPGSGILALLDLNKIDVPLIGCKWSPGPWTKASRLVLFLRAPHPLCTPPYFLMHILGGHLVSSSYY